MLEPVGALKGNQHNFYKDIVDYFNDKKMYDEKYLLQLEDMLKTFLKPFCYHISIPVYCYHYLK